MPFSLVLLTLVSQTGAADAGLPPPEVPAAEAVVQTATDVEVSATSDAGLPAQAVAPALEPSTPVAVVEEPVAPANQTVVTASRSERKASDVVVPTEVINRAQIEATGARDLAQLLQQQQGAELIYTNRGVGLRLQGLDPVYVLVLVDGQRVAGRSGSITDISRFSLREVERVEIVKGPAAALYGADAIGGVVNLITRRPQRPLEGSVRGAFGSLMEGDLRGNAGSKLGSLELRAGGGYRTRNPYDWNPDDVAQSGPGLRRMDGDLDVTWQPTSAIKAWGRTSYALTDLGAIDLNDTGAVFDRYQRTEQYDAWLGARDAVTADTSISLRGHYGLFRDQFMLDQRGSRALDDYSQNLTRLWELYAQADQRWGQHLLAVGAEGLQESLNSSRVDPSFVRRRRGGLFAQDTFSTTLAGWRVSFEPGIRGDVDSQFGGAPSPRVALKVDPLDELTVRAAWGMGFRPPTFTELYMRFSNPGIGYIVEGNPQLTSERSNSFNLSADWRLPLSGWSVSVSAWRTNLTNLINITAYGVPNPDDPVTFSYENVASAYTQGAEVSLRMRPYRAVYLDLGYTGMDARDLTRNRPLEGRSAHRVSGQLSAKVRPLRLEALVRCSWASPRPYYVGQGLGFANVLGFGEERVVWTPGYVDLEGQLTIAATSWLKVFVNGYNLLNSGDQNFNPRPPRGVLGGLQVDL